MFEVSLGDVMRWFMGVIFVMSLIPMMGQGQPENSTTRETGIAAEGDLSTRPMIRAVTIAPDVADARYGPAERNVLDLYKAKSDRPTPLVVYFHGGGFVEGDKRRMDLNLLMPCLAQGISVASVNYRYSTQAPAPAPFMDAARAVQFLRMNAAKWKLDPKRFGAVGNSAGGGMVLWLAFRDDMADPKSDDPVLRESTRLKCVYGTAAQCSYDPRFIKANIPGNAWKHAALIKLFDLGPGENENPPPEKAKLMEDLAAINHVRAGGPPVYLWYGQDRSVPTGDTAADSTIHHPKFGDLMKEKLDALKIECIVKVKEPATDPTPVEFLKRCLGE